MTNYSIPLDRVFHALADPTRREVLKQLGESQASVSEMAEPFQMALPSFMQHLEVLEKSGLVESTKIGRTRFYKLTPQPLIIAEDWLLEQRSVWECRLDQLESYLKKIQKVKK